jgi:hypothetical protein
MSRTTRAGFVKRNASIIATGGYATATTSYPAGTKIWSSACRDTGSSWMTSILRTSAAVLVGLRPLTSLLAFGAPLCDTSVALRLIRYFFDREGMSCSGHRLVKSLSYGVLSGYWSSVAYPHIRLFPRETDRGRWFCESSLSASIPLNRCVPTSAVRNALSNSKVRLNPIP